MGSLPPWLSDTLWNPGKKSLHRSVRRRVRRRLDENRGINEVLRVLEAAASGTLVEPPDPSSGSIDAATDADVYTAQSLLRIRGVLNSFGKLSKSYEETDAVAFGALTANATTSYGDRPDLARYGEGPPSLPPADNCAIDIESKLFDTTGQPFSNQTKTGVYY